eukprot:681444-Amorphochlora_amoeboformis.AAC.1
MDQACILRADSIPGRVSAIVTSNTRPDGRQPNHQALRRAVPLRPDESGGLFLMKKILYLSKFFLSEFFERRRGGRGGGFGRRRLFA